MVCSAAVHGAINYLVAQQAGIAVLPAASCSLRLRALLALLPATPQAQELCALLQEARPAAAWRRRPGHRGSGRCRHTAGWVVKQQLHDIGRTPLLCCSTTAALVALATAAGSAGGHMARCDSAPSRLCTPTRTTPGRDVRRAVVRVFRPTRLQFWILRCEALRITRTEIPLTRHACSLRPCSCTTDPLIKRPVPSSAALCHLVPSVTMGPAGKGALSILLLCCSNAFMTTGGLPCHHGPL